MYIFELNLFWFHIAPSYYWLMYVIWVIVWYFHIKRKKIVDKSLLDTLIFYWVLSIIIGWRLWYMLFYDLKYYIDNPINILKIWQWWMSFHWWLIWVIIWVIIFCKKYKYYFFKVIDEFAYIVPIWILAWRIWNYINKELLWYPNYNWLFAIYKNWIWYFPSPLLEALF